MATAVIDIDQLLEIDPQEGLVLVRGSRIPVQQIVGLHLDGFSAEAIARSSGEVSVSAVYAALSYYYQHQAELDAEDERDHLEAMALAEDLGAEIL
jgi:uncharacterized protein (DUF433 family)